MTIKVDADQAAEMLYGLMQSNAWLISVSPARHDDAAVEREALVFILSVAEQGVDAWGNCTQAVKETVSLLMTDFLAKLMHPQSPFANRQWEVSATGSSFDRILAIIAYEIRRAHPLLPTH